MYEYKCSVIKSNYTNSAPELINLRKWGKMIASKKLAWEEGKEEMDQLGGMIFISPPCFKMHY